MSRKRTRGGDTLDTPRAPRVEVREHSGGRDLIVDGTYASFLRPSEATTGSVWDAIAVPWLALPPARRRRALILGLGGGSVARILRALSPRAKIVGVEFDPEVVEAARRAFDLDELAVEVVVDDALSVLQRERRLFDAVFEDVFVGAGDAVRKPAWLPRPGLELAVKRLADGGLLVSNTLDETWLVADVLRGIAPRVLRIDVNEYDNRILVAGPKHLSARGLRKAVAAEPTLREALDRLRFRTLPPC